MRSFRIAFVLLALLVARIAAAQGYSSPPPVDLGISNIPQHTSVWCWVAVAQQIIAAKNGPNTPAQCAMAGAATGVPPDACCGGHPQCIRPGALQEIQQLLAYFGGSYSSLAPPADPMTLYNTLSMGYAVILQLSTVPPGTTGGMAHVVVLRGMSWQQTPYGIAPFLLINDPMAYYTQAVPYSSIRPIWQSAIVVKVW